MIPKGATEYILISIQAVKKRSLQIILLWTEGLLNFREFIQMRPTYLRLLQAAEIPEADKRWSDLFGLCLLVGKGNSLLQSRWSCASRDRVSKRFTKNSQLKAGISAFRKWSSKSLLRIVGLSLTTVSNWKSRQRQRPYRRKTKQNKKNTKLRCENFQHFFKANRGQNSQLLQLISTAPSSY